MKKYHCLLLFIGFAAACQEPTKDHQRSLVQSTAQDTARGVEQIDTSSVESGPRVEITYLDSIIDGHILMPFTYRVWEGNEVSKVINKDWLELSRMNGGYHVRHASYRIENDDEEPCSGLPTETIVPEEDVLLFFNIPAIQQGPVDSVSFTTSIIASGTSLAFSFQNHAYKVSATGIRFHKDEERNNPEARYTLKLYKDGKYIRTIIDQTSYNDTATELRFIGDLDKDGQPDFIFSSPRDYEEMRMIIILSGSAAAYDGHVQFDC